MPGGLTPGIPAVIKFSRAVSDFFCEAHGIRAKCVRLDSTVNRPRQSKAITEELNSIFEGFVFDENWREWAVPVSARFELRITRQSRPQVELDRRKVLLLDDNV